MRFNFRITEVNNELLAKYPDVALDGDLSILIKDEVFLDENGISLLGLAIHVAGWLNEVRANRFIDFDYSSDEYQENPVLHLARIESNYYAITSSWVETPANNILDLGAIISCFDTFLKELDNVIQQCYGVAFSDMTFLSQLYRK